MLSFAFEFPIKDRTANEFVDTVRTWLEGSPHSALASSDFEEIPSSGRWKTQTGTEQLEALLVQSNNRETAAFRYISRDSSVEWTTTVVFSKTEVDTWVGLRTARESYEAQLPLPPALKPHLVKTILTNLGGGLDGELYVSDKPYYLKANDLNMAVRLLNADADNYLPVVYISCGFFGEQVIDPVPLARTLGGMAHVLVEPNRNFSRSLQADVGSRNVYGGRVGIYWPNGERYVSHIGEQTPDQSAVRKLLANRIRLALLNRRPFARCTWSQAEAEIAREAFEHLKQAGSENIDEYIAAFDSEISVKTKQLEDAEAEVLRLKSQLRSTEYNRMGNGIRLETGTEQSYFDGEVTEILRDALNGAISQAQDNGRRQHVLAGIVSLMPQYDNIKSRREELKDTLRQYRSMDKDTRERLEKLGFSITDDGKHYKLVYTQDERYTFPLPKSGSDYRGGLNSVSDIGKRVF